MLTFRLNSQVGKLSVLIYNFGYLISLIFGAILAVALPYEPAEVDGAASVSIVLGFTVVYIFIYIYIYFTTLLYLIYKSINKIMIVKVFRQL